jgi:hypothetical protein
MAVCWHLPQSIFDKESAWSPERYSPERAQQNALAENSVPLTKLVSLRKETFNPVGGRTDRTRMFIVLDTNHAYEGRVQFRGRSAPVSEVGSIKRPLQPGYVIVSRLRTYLRQIALIDDEFLDDFNCGLLCSTEFYVLAPIDNGDIAFLVPFLLSELVQNAFAAAEEGGHHPRIPSDVLLNLPVPRSIVDQRDDLSSRVRKSIRLIRDGEKVMRGLHRDTATLSIHPGTGNRELIRMPEPPPRARRARATA